MNRKRRARPNEGSLVLPHNQQLERDLAERHEMMKLLTKRLQEIKDTDYTLSEVFEKPLDTDNAGITTFRIACFLEQMTPVWKNRAVRNDHKNTEVDVNVVKGDDSE